MIENMKLDAVLSQDENGWVLKLVNPTTHDIVATIHASMMFLQNLCRDTFNLDLNRAH